MLSLEVTRQPLCLSSESITPAASTSAGELSLSCCSLRPFLWKDLQPWLQSNSGWPLLGHQESLSILSVCLPRMGVASHCLFIPLLKSPSQRCCQLLAVVESSEIVLSAFCVRRDGSRTNPLIVLAQ